MYNSICIVKPLQSPPVPSVFFQVRLAKAAPAHDKMIEQELAKQGHDAHAFISQDTLKSFSASCDQIIQMRALINSSAASRQEAVGLLNRLYASIQTPQSN